jgi:hypothetical protein
MKNIVMELVRVSRKPSPIASSERGISPKARLKNESATSQSVARTVPRVRFRMRRRRVET